MKNKNDKRFWIRCNDEEYNLIANAAKEKGVGMGDIVLAHYFNYEIIPPVAADVIKTVPMEVIDKKGNKKIYEKKYVVKGRPTIIRDKKLEPIST